MKIEHITLGGNSIIKDTDDSVYQETIDLLKNSGFKINGKADNKTLSVLFTDFKVRITYSEGILMFDILKGDQMFFTNICSLHKSRKMDAMSYVIASSKNLESLGFGEPKEPKHGAFIYTIPVNPFALMMLEPDEMVKVADIEFCAYYVLLLSAEMNY